MLSIPGHVKFAYQTIAENLEFCRAALFPGLATSLESVLKEPRPPGEKPPWLMLPLFACEALGGDLEPVYHVAAALELGRIAAGCVDEWQDQDTTDALWQVIGAEQTINLAMAMVALSQMSLFRLADLVEPTLLLRLQEELSLTMLHMSEGQHADLSGHVSLSNYADVAGAKTGSLLRLGCRAGAILAGASDETIARYGDFGQNLGILAQAWNDLFGLAGLGGKRDIDHSRTLPILAALALDGPGHEPDSAEGQAGQLYALTQIHSLYRQAGETLARCPAQGHLGLFLDGYSLERWLGPEALQLRSSGEDDNAA